MDTPAFDAKMFVRSALRSIVFYFSIIVISSMTMVELAQAEGTVAPAVSYTVTTPPAPPGGSGNYPSAQAACTGYLAWLATYANATVPRYDWTMVLGAVTETSCVYYSISASGAGDCRGTACNGLLAVSRPACPANSSGTTTCTCNTSYVPDPTGTSCIPEQYTISLSGLGGVVMPNQTRTAYAQVNTGTGSPKSGIPVNLALTVAPEEDGQLYSAHVGLVSPNGGSTDANGKLSFEFRAPVAGGTHTITATCTNCTNSPVTGTITVPGCPVPDLTAPPFTDACATVLENIGSTQAQKNAACGALTPALVAGRNCLSTKLSQLTPAIPMRITSDIRSVAYQAHLREIWNSMKRVVKWMDDNPTIQAACAARRAELAAEKGCDKAGPCKSEPNEVCYPESSTQRSHCLVARPANPSPSDANHTQGKAFDVSRTRTIDPLQAVLDARTPPQKIPQFLSAPTNCNLSWGGAFDDDVHFYVP